MIFQIGYGRYLRGIYQAEKGHGEGWPQIIVSLSMLFSGLYGQEPHGGIYRRTTGVGAILIAVSFAGVTKVSGKNCWKS